MSESFQFKLRHIVVTWHTFSPLYSDVEFVLPRRGKVGPRSIYAARKLLRRVDYYDASSYTTFPAV